TPANPGPWTGPLTRCPTWWLAVTGRRIGEGLIYLHPEGVQNVGGGRVRGCVHSPSSVPGSSALAPFCSCASMDSADQSSAPAGSTGHDAPATSGRVIATAIGAPGPRAPARGMYRPSGGMMWATSPTDAANALACS